MNAIEQYIDNLIGVPVVENPTPSAEALELLRHWGLQPDWFVWSSISGAQTEVDGESIGVSIFNNYVIVHDVGVAYTPETFAHNLKQAAQQKKLQHEIDERPVLFIAHDEPWEMVEFQKMGYRFVGTREYGGMMSVIYVHKSHLPDYR